MNHRAFILVGVIFALLLGALVLHQGDLAWMTLPFLAYLGLGILKAPAAELVRLQATRSVKSTRHEQGKMVVTVDVALGNRGSALERLTMADAPQPGHQRPL